MKSAGKARNNGLYRHIRTSKEIIRNLLNDFYTTTKAMQKFLTNQYGHNWEGSLNFEKVEKYLPYFKSAIQVPIYVIGIDV